MTGLVRFSSSHQEDMAELNPTAATKNQGAVAWLKKIGMIGFMFFLVKGLLWLTIPLVLVFAGYEI